MLLNRIRRPGTGTECATSATTLKTAKLGSRYASPAVSTRVEPPASCAKGAKILGKGANHKQRESENGGEQGRGKGGKHQRQRGDDDELQDDEVKRHQQKAVSRLEAMLQIEQRRRRNRRS